MQLAFLLWAARMALPPALHCQVCDTSYYYTAAAEIAKSGLLFFNPYDGYRSYFVPFFIASVQWLAASAGFDGGAVERYTYGVTLLFWLVSSGLMWWLANRVRVLTFWMTSAATLLNPILLVYVPFALQEGVLMVCCLPLLFVWAGAKDMEPSRRAALVMMLALLAYIIRSSLVWWLPLAAIYAGWLLWPQIRHPRRWLPWTVFVVFAGCLLIGPQIHISNHKSGSFNPYPSTTPLAQQIAWGVTLLKFATVEDEGHWRGLTYWSPFVAEPEEDKTVGFYLKHPMRGAFLMLGHAYAGFHYDQITPYWRLDRARPLTIWLVLSSAIVFLGVVRMTAIVIARDLDADRAFAIATVALCVASLVLLATESRFGIVGFAMLSIQVAEWISTRPSCARWSWLGPGLLMYLALSFLYNTLLLQSADIKL
ncbi:MAG: hypothetical protein ABWZ29_08125 [Casimicrobiaceae bacterium]